MTSNQKLLEQSRWNKKPSKRRRSLSQPLKSRLGQSTAHSERSKKNYRPLKTHLTPSEHEIQCTFFAMLPYTFPNILAFAIPNGGDRHPAVAGKLRAEGVQAGIPDVCVAEPRHRFHGLYLEFKRHGQHPSLEQQTKLEALRDRGYATAVVRSVDEAVLVLRDYLDGQG